MVLKTYEKLLKTTHQIDLSYKVVRFYIKKLNNKPNIPLPR